MVEKKSWTDAEFIEGIKNSDAKALTGLYKKFFKIVLRHVIANSGTEQEAKDIYQESILVLYYAARKDSFQLNCQLQTYIFSVAKRLWLKQIRNNGRTVSLEKVTSQVQEEDVQAEIEEYEQKEKELGAMTTGLERLGEPCKTLLTDFYYKKMGMEDIAEKFGYTNADNAKNQKYKCLQRLKRIVLNE